MDVAGVAQAGAQLFAVKLLMTSVSCLWVYDYLLTIGDEVTYAWFGKRSWVFALFIVTRYTPVFYLVWSYLIMFQYTKPSTKWVPIFHAATIAFLAQIVVGLRVYGLNGRKKLIGGALALPIALLFCHGVLSVAWIALHPLEPLPEINLDPFKFCIYKRWRPGELTYCNLTIFFDLLAFSIILVTAKRSWTHRYPGIPNILDTVVRDSTQYFLLIFFVQLLAELFILFAPEQIQLLPSMATGIFVPVMASRLMLSLKKATSMQKTPWSLETMTMNQGRSTEDETDYSPPRVPNELHETSRTSTAPNQEDVELATMPRLSRDRDSHHLR